MGILSWLFGDRHRPDRQLDGYFEGKRGKPPKKDQTLVRIDKDLRAGVYDGEFQKLRDAPDGAIVRYSTGEDLKHWTDGYQLGPLEFSHEYTVDYRGVELCKHCGKSHQEILVTRARCRTVRGI